MVTDARTPLIQLDGKFIGLLPPETEIDRNRLGFAAVPKTWRRSGLSPQVRLNNKGKNDGESFVSLRHKFFRIDCEVIPMVNQCQADSERELVLSLTIRVRFSDKHEGKRLLDRSIDCNRRGVAPTDMVNRIVATFLHQYE